MGSARFVPKVGRFVHKTESNAIMRIPKYGLVIVAAALLTAAACGDDDSTGEQAELDASSETSDGTDDETNGTVADGVADGVAAVVDGEEISAASIDEAVEGLAESPQFSEQLAGPEGEAARAQLAAQVLSSVITTNIASTSAEELGRPVTDEDRAEARTELEDQAGGPEELDAAIEQQGLTDDLLELELTSLAAIRNVQEALDEEAGAETPETTAPEETAPGSEELSPSEQRVQEYLVGVLADAEVSVHADYGVWDAQTAQVTPPGGAPAPAPGG